MQITATCFRRQFFAPVPRREAFHHEETNCYLPHCVSRYVLSQRVSDFSVHNPCKINSSSSFCFGSYLALLTAANRESAMNDRKRKWPSGGLFEEITTMKHHMRVVSLWFFVLTLGGLM